MSAEGSGVRRYDIRSHGNGFPPVVLQRERGAWISVDEIQQLCDSIGDNDLQQSIEALGDICDFAYRYGYHELGYDPVEILVKVRDEIDRFRAALRGEVKP